MLISKRINWLRLRIYSQARHWERSPLMHCMFCVLHRIPPSDRSRFWKPARGGSTTTAPLTSKSVQTEINTPRTWATEQECSMQNPAAFHNFPSARTPHIFIPDDPKARTPHGNMLRKERATLRERKWLISVSHWMAGCSQIWQTYEPLPPSGAKEFDDLTCSRGIPSVRMHLAVKVARQADDKFAVFPVLRRVHSTYEALVLLRFSFNTFSSLPPARYHRKWGLFAATLKLQHQSPSMCWVLWS